MKKFLIIFLSLFLFSCGHNSQKVAENPQTETEKIANISENSEKIPETEKNSQNSEIEKQLSDKQINIVISSYSGPEE